MSNTETPFPKAGQVIRSTIAPEIIANLLVGLTQIAVFKVKALPYNRALQLLMTLETKDERLAENRVEIQTQGADA
ncbi:MAG: hypothetical protein GKR98_04925 [Boseongicola sp.]|nr:MAG: hypothetical protein GKR98_04925 [Boseongicola sp.]